MVRAAITGTQSSSLVLSSVSSCVDMRASSFRRGRSFSAVAAVGLVLWACSAFPAFAPGADLEVSFGKYRGSLLSEVVQKDAGYCQWLLSASADADATDVLIEAADWIKTNAPDVADTTAEPVLRFGKYQGSLVSEVVQTDVAYCRWILSASEDGDASHSLIEAADWIRTNAPDVADMTAGPVLQFGKYRGSLLSEVVKEDPDYCQWILSASEEAEASRGFLQVADWIKTNAPDVANVAAQPVLKFGKYRGSLLSEIVQTDVDYCRWILSKSEDGDATQILRQAADWIRTNAPDVAEGI